MTYLVFIIALLSILLIVSNTFLSKRGIIDRIILPISVGISYYLFLPDNYFFLLIGFVFVLLGDFIFAFDKQDNHFIKGLLSFAVAYTFYTISFVLNSTSSDLYIVTLFFMIGISAIVYNSMDFHDRNYSKFQLPVFAYFTIMILMVTASSLAGNYLTVIGALLLFICDVTIGLNSFKYNTMPRDYKDLYVFLPYNLGHFLMMYSLIGDK